MSCPICGFSGRCIHSLKDQDFYNSAKDLQKGKLSHLVDLLQELADLKSENKELNALNKILEDDLDSLGPFRPR